MNLSLPETMLEALRLTKAGKLMEATAAIQHALAGSSPADQAPDSTLLEATQTPEGSWSVPAGEPNASAPRPGPAGLHDMFGALEQVGRKKRRVPVEPVPPGAQFQQRQFGNSVGTRPYKLYIPSRHAAATEPLPLIVMLHGCTQSADDFAAGTKMNHLAEEGSFLVAYPEQIKSANPSRCWNWFNTAEQGRAGTEASLIAGITQDIMAKFRVDPKRVYIAGLSAGGAAAAIMASSYPDLYAAVGVHSGLACGVAHDMPSAFAAMRNGGNRRAVKRSGAFVPTIVFHGDADKTVHPTNGEQVIAQAGLKGTSSGTTVEQGRSAGGVAYTRTTWRDATGNIISERWLLHGTGHAWAGGSASGSYTDPRGPDASREMIRFFMSNRQRDGVAN